MGLRSTVKDDLEIPTRITTECEIDEEQLQYTRRSLEERTSYGKQESLTQRIERQR